MGGIARCCFVVCMQMNVDPDLSFLGLNLMQPLALTLQSLLAISAQHCAAAHALHPAPTSYTLSTRLVSIHI